MAYDNAMLEMFEDIENGEEGKIITKIVLVFLLTAESVCNNFHFWLRILCHEKIKNSSQPRRTI